jgi:predicted dehydrogenase
MDSRMDRRSFLGVAAASLVPMSRAAESPVRIGIVGVGNRGSSLLQLMLSMKDVSIPALCDIDVQHLAAGQKMVQQSGRPEPEGYSRNEHDFERLMSRDDLDAVVIATPWEWHTIMAVYCMKAGKFTACEVPAALTFEECWSLIDTHEKTGTPYMMLENWYREDSLAAHMTRAAGETSCLRLFARLLYWHFDGLRNGAASS